MTVPVSEQVDPTAGTSRADRGLRRRPGVARVIGVAVVALFAVMRTFQGFLESRQEKKAAMQKVVAAKAKQQRK